MHPRLLLTALDGRDQCVGLLLWEKKQLRWIMNQRGIDSVVYKSRRTVTMGSSDDDVLAVKAG